MKVRNAATAVMPFIESQEVVIVHGDQNGFNLYRMILPTEKESNNSCQSGCSISSSSLATDRTTAPFLIRRHGNVLLQKLLEKS